MRRAPRLLWVNHFAVAPDMGGGTRHVELARELVRLGWEVTVAASDFHLHRRTYTRRRGAADRAPVRETIDGVDVRWLWAAPYTRNDLRRLRNWTSFGDSLRALDLPSLAPDLVIGSTPHLFAASASLRLARRRGVPFVLEVRDLWPESLDVGAGRGGPAARGSRWALYWALWTMARRLYRAADRIIVLAKGAGEYLARTGVSRDKIAFVPNGVDAAGFASAPRDCRDRMRLVYAGAHGPANGLEAVLDAAALLGDDPRVSFVLVGDGPAKSELVARAHRLNLTNVEFRDPIAKSAMPGFLASCDAGLMVLKPLPLFSFGVSPNKLFDYWGASLPVVCNVPGEVQGWLEEARGGVQAPDATGAGLAAAVRQLLELPPPDRCALGANGNAWVRRERDRPVVAAHLDAVLRGILAERATRAGAA